MPQLQHGRHHTTSETSNGLFHCSQPAAANIITIVCFEIFVVVKAFRGNPSRRHFFLGQCLLLGLLLMSGTGVTFALQPSHATCTTSRVLTGLSPSIVFGSLLVKCVFLISVHSGVYLPAYYQGLLLFFIVLVQGVITIQWIATYPTSTRLSGNESLYDFYWLCESSYKHFIISLLYVMALILMVAIFSIKCRRIRDNYRESSYIGFSLCIVVPMWLVWTLTGFVLDERVQPACIGFGSVLTASIVFVLMFIPKGRQLSAAGNEGFFKEDRDSSISSCTDEKYSPSFFMFHPIKPSKHNAFSGRKDDLSIYKPNITDSTTLPGEETVEGIYATIETEKDFRMSSNPNFYLFRSHSNIEMMY
ncbi:UNVERIFIED_CONTAM: hypothetical protein RMT77_004123 [Armadillidium vulgare]